MAHRRFGATHWPSLKRTVQTVFAEIELRKVGKTERDLPNYSMIIMLDCTGDMTQYLQEHDSEHGPTAMWRCSVKAEMKSNQVELLRIRTNVIVCGNRPYGRI